MRILLLHPGFPGQFKHLIPALQARGDELWAISGPRPARQIPRGIRYAAYTIHRGNGRDTLPLATEFETKVIRGQAAATVAARLSSEGFRPDLILGHPGWGEMLFLGDVWPDVPQLHYVEFFHGVPGTDNDIDDLYAQPQTWEQLARARVKNANLLTNLNQMTVGITPTTFQHSLLPSWAQQRTHVIHDGIDTDWLSPDPTTQLQIPGGPLLRAGDPVVTFVNRTFEPYRGIHVFLEALAQLQAKHRTVLAVLVGSDTPKVSYGAHRTDGRGWLTALRDQMGDRLDWSRIRPLGTVTHSVLRDLYRVSAAHIYLTYPFVLSWSLLEAMSCGALVIGSATPPVQEVIQHGNNGLLVPFADAAGLASLLEQVLCHSENLQPLRLRARQLIQERYKLVGCLEKQLALINQLSC